MQFLHREFIHGHKIIWRDKFSSSAASPTCLLSAFDHPLSNCPFPCFLSLSLFVSLFLLGRLPIWKDGKQRPDLHPPSVPLARVCSVNSVLTNVNRGQHVRWWTSVQMSPVETAVVCLLLRVFPALQGLLFPSTDPKHKDRAAHSSWP